MQEPLSAVLKALRQGELNQDEIGFLKRWPLLHFSPNSHQIQQEGFRFGENNIHGLDCTYSHLQERKQHQQPSYAFAFNAAAWNVENDMLDFEIAGPTSMRNLTGMYAESALLFSGNGLYTRHFDEFNQVICWGPDIDTSTSLLLSNAGPQELDGEVVQDENGNAVDCWTLTSIDGKQLVSAEEYLTLTECVVKGICRLSRQKLLGAAAIKEVEALYPIELENLGLTLRAEEHRKNDELCP